MTLDGRLNQTTQRSFLPRTDSEVATLFKKISHLNPKGPEPLNPPENAQNAKPHLKAQGCALQGPNHSREQLGIPSAL